MPERYSDLAAGLPDTETACSSSSAAGFRQSVIDELLGELSVTDIRVETVRASAGATRIGASSEGETFLLLTEGSWACRFPAESMRADPGDLLHLNRAEALELISYGSAARAAGVLIRFSARISDTLELCELFEFPKVLKVGTQSAIWRYLMEAARVDPGGSLGRKQALASLVTLILLSLIRDHQQEIQMIVPRRGMVQMRRLLPAIRALRNDLGSATSIEVIAQRCGLSVSQFRRIFHDVFEQSPTSYIQQRRLQEACRLLRLTDCTVGEICLRIGYEQPSHFHKTFKKHTGVTPRNYRARAVLVSPGNRATHHPTGSRLVSFSRFAPA